MIYLAYIFALLLVIVCALALLVILMQRPSANAGMGAALGGGAAESVFGGDSANVLNKMTYSLIAIFFVLSFGLYLGFLANSKSTGSSNRLDELTKEQSATPAPVEKIAPAPVSTPAPAATPAPAPAPAK